MMVPVWNGLSLGETLKKLGYTTAPVPGGYEVEVRRDRVVFTGRAISIWNWLLSTGQIDGIQERYPSTMEVRSA